MAADRCDLLCLDLKKAEAIRRERPAIGELESIAAEAKALADPTRLLIGLALAKGGELCVCDLSWIAEKPENLVSHHLRALRKAAFVKTRREHKVVFYSLNLRGRSAIDRALAGKAAEVDQ